MAPSSTTAPAPTTPGTLAEFLFPAIAVQTCHAPGEGIHEPQVLWPHLQSLHQVPGRDDPLPVRVLLADRTLAELPAAIAAFGRDRVAVGALVQMPLPTAAERLAILADALGSYWISSEK